MLMLNPPNPSIIIGCRHGIRHITSHLISYIRILPIPSSNGQKNIYFSSQDRIWVELDILALLDKKNSSCVTYE